MNTRDALLLTLGHGSSAILVKDGQIVNGYQLERLTRVKGDSRFPAIAIEMLEKFDDIPEDIPIYISHWSPSGSIDDMNDKHYNKEYLRQKFPESIIIACTSSFTHHDAHAFSALAYNNVAQSGSHILVADGFGNIAEVLSLYQVNPTGITLLKRVHGYNQSLGLLYQYATDYVGLRQNRDEWKLNAKATHCPEEDIPWVTEYADKYVKALVYKQENYVLGPDDPLTNLGALSHTHKMVVDTLKVKFKPEDKAQIALFLQTVVERCLQRWIDTNNITQLTVVGGCFLNVQLNGYLASKVESFCAMPLSGDEGAAMGLFYRYNPDFSVPDDLCFGKRSLRQQDMISHDSYILFCSDPDNFTKIVSGLLGEDKIVNVVRDGMEYGPRAYCNTSTLALPTRKNREYINHVNERDPDMPMCPVLTRKQFKTFFKNTNNIVRSVKHMIVTLPYTGGFVSSDSGICHFLLDGSATGRPQVVDPTCWIYSVCQELGPLINTSFNNHGKPICYDMRDVEDCHGYMKSRDIEGRVFTVVLEDSKPQLEFEGFDL